MGEKEVVSEWGGSVKVPPNSHGFIPRMLFLDDVAGLKCDHFYRGLPKWFKAIVAYLKASSNEKMYSD